MRLFPLLIAVFALLASFPAPAAEGAQPLLVPTIAGPLDVPAARPWSYGGKIGLLAPTGHVPLPIPLQRVVAHLDGVAVDADDTDASGQYSVRVNFPVGTHVLDARILGGTEAEGQGPPITVRAYPTWPAAPTLFAGHGFWIADANVSWSYPWTDGGHPVISYELQRATGGPWTTVLSANATAFVDPNVIPGQNYSYRVRATTSYGTGNWTVREYHHNDTIATVQINSYRLCSSVNCTSVSDGGLFNTSALANVTVVANLSGIVDDHPIAPPGYANRTVHAYIGLPESVRFFTDLSGAGGYWTAEPTGLHATAPASGCAAVPVMATARPDWQGRTAFVGSFTLCAT